jgi:hypothetical protein
MGGTGQLFRLAVVTAAAGLTPLLSSGATPYSEPFNSSLSGWTNNGAVAWTAGSAAVSATFPVFAGPVSAVLMAGAGASGGALVGDFDAAGILLMGFSFRADHIKPSSLLLQWRCGTNAVFRELKDLILVTGAWHRLVFSLASPAAGGWVTSLDDAAFVDMQTNVTSISVLVEGQSLSSTVRYWLDDFFIAGAQSASRLQATTNGYGDLTWVDVQSNFTYRLEFAAEPGGVWSNMGLTTATSSNLVSNVALSNALQGVYRLVLP